jgi:hypothetical protein
MTRVKIYFLGNLARRGAGEGGGEGGNGIVRASDRLSGGMYGDGEGGNDGEA